MNDAEPNFELKQDALGRVGVARLAEILGVTDETIYNYEKRGMISCGVGPDGAKVWDIEAAKAWRETSGPSRVKGGKRRGAGRKPAAVEKAEKAGEVATDLAAMFAAHEARLLEAGVNPEVAKKAGDIEALLEAVKTGRCSLADLEKVSTGTQAAQRLVELQKKMGELVPIKEAEAEFGQYLSYARITLDNLPGRAAPEIAALFQLPADAVAKVRDVLLAQVGIVKKQLQERH